MEEEGTEVDDLGLVDGAIMSEEFRDGLGEREGESSKEEASVSKISSPGMHTDLSSLGVLEKVPGRLVPPLEDITTQPLEVAGLS